VRVALVVATTIAAGSTVAIADSFTPVRLAIGVAPVARVHEPLRITVAVSADPSVLDNRTAPLRVEVKLANECGANFETTPGTTLLNKVLNPQPATGQAYAARARGSGRPSGYGIKTACVYLEEEGDDRLFASDQSLSVNVSRSCTVAASRYDRHRTRARGRAARRACGQGVPL
jgi:hypothetical protein